jgi:hypothetical protein
VLVGFGPVLWSGIVSCTTVLAHQLATLNLRYMQAHAQSPCCTYWNLQVRRQTASILCQSQWHCHQAWPGSAFRGCLGHGLECLGFVGGGIGIVVVSVMSTSEIWGRVMSLCCAMLSLVRETAFLAWACRFGSVLRSGIVSCSSQHPKACS